MRWWGWLLIGGAMGIAGFLGWYVIPLIWAVAFHNW